MSSSCALPFQAYLLRLTLLTQTALYPWEIQCINSNLKKNFLEVTVTWLYITWSYKTETFLWKNLYMCIYNKKYSKLIFSHDSQLMGNRFMAHFHASLESTCKSRISKNWGSIIFHHVQAKSELKNFRWDPGQTGGSIIFQLLMLISEMQVLHCYLSWGFLQY